MTDPEDFRQGPYGRSSVPDFKHTPPPPPTAKQEKTFGELNFEALMLHRMGYDDHRECSECVHSVGKRDVPGLECHLNPAVVLPVTAKGSCKFFKRS